MARSSAIASSSDERTASIRSRREGFSVEEAQEWIDELDFKELAKEGKSSDLAGREGKEVARENESSGLGDHSGEGSSEIEKVTLLKKMRMFMSVRQITVDQEESQDDKDQYPEGYDKEIAKMLIDHSTAAYCPTCGSVAPIMECGCHIEVDAVSGFVKIQRSYNEYYDASAFCGYDKANKAIIVAFRGTASLTNWKANMKFAKATLDAGIVTRCEHPYPKGVKVHKGFYDTYASVAPEVVSGILHLVKKYPDFQVYVTGHSMG